MIEKSWQANLRLRISSRAGKSVLTGCSHQGPLRVQKALYPEGKDLCHLILLHPPGGIAGGDTLAVHLTVEENGRALITTPGAGKWYRSGGAKAEQSIQVQVGRGGCLEWLPQENIFFHGADAVLGLQVEIDEQAVFLGLETSCLGRMAAGEQFTAGTIRFTSRISRTGRLLWNERGRLEGGSPWLDHPAGLAGQPILTTLLAVGPMVDDELLANCRKVELLSGLACGTTLLPGGLLVARCLSASVEPVRQWFVALWTVLRPAMIGKKAEVPRIWNT